MIRGFLNIMVGALFDVITPALGNLAATETVEGKQGGLPPPGFFLRVAFRVDEHLSVLPL